MINVTEFVTYIRPNVSGCADLLIKREVVQAAIKLCSESFLWREETQPHSIVKGVGKYELYLPNNQADATQLESLIVNGKDLRPITIEELNSRNKDWRTAMGEPTRYYQINSHVLIGFDRIPNETNATGMIGSFALKPKRNATKLPEFLFTDWLEAIESGVLSRLLLMPNREWTDKELGSYHKNLWEQELGKARIHVNQGWSDGPLRATGNRVMSRKSYF